MKNNRAGFTLIEILVCIAVIGILAGSVLVMSGSATASARDARRKSELQRIGRLFLTSCYMPNGGPGTYDIATLADELKTKYPQFAGQISSMPKDPKIGTTERAYYEYKVSEDGGKCAIYANLERGSEPATLTGITEPTPGGGTGVLQATAGGWNGSDKYFQVSN